MAPAHDEAPAASRGLEERAELRSYGWGLALALVLTVPPFALVQSAAMPGLPLRGLIGVFALAQVIVHLRFFLQVSFGQKREIMLLLLFSALLLLIMLAGTIWIMASLATRMALPVQP